MSGNIWLDWATLSISVFNTVIMLWMGLMILLSADKRTWGVWLASGGLLFGAMFFISHTAIIGQEISFFSAGTNFWWHAGWWPVIAAPFAWYIVMLWFSGYWENSYSRIRIRHKPWLNVTVIYSVLLVILILFLNPIDSLSSRSNLDYEAGPAFSGVPVLFIAYPLYILLCIALSMDALLKPGPSSRFMGDQAREKTRPWLAGAGFILLVVSVLVGYTILMVFQNARQSSFLPELFQNIAPTLGIMDLILSFLIAVAALLVGQAVVSYGIFTGKPLPRRLFKRQWINTLIFAGTIAVIVAGSIQIRLRMVYSLLLAVVIISTFFAFITWRYLSERDRAINQVRPFLTSPKLVQSILMQSSRKSGQMDMQRSFNALVSDILEVDRAVLMPVGATSTLLNGNIYFPDNMEIPQVSPEILDELKNDVKHLGVPLQVEENGEFSWLVPLWSERGIIGMLFLGRKADGSFITQEEIELARAASERLLDMSLSAELSGRLVDLQQKRLSEQSILDLHPRRVLHDEVLPALHTAMLQISAGNANKETVIGQLADTHKMISSLLQELPSVYTPQLEKAGFAYVIQQLIKVEFPHTFTAIDWEWTIEDAAIVNDLPILKKEVLYYAFREAVRNAANHANPSVVEEGVRLIVRIKVERNVEITVQDNGKGSAADNRDTSGSRQGLAIHSTFMALIGGELIFESEPASYARVRLICPLSA